MSTMNGKLLKITSSQPGNWIEQAWFRRTNKAWLKKSAFVALKVLGALKAQGLSKEDLAEKMNVSPQQINKIVRGHENLTLETIANLEKALGILIIIIKEDAVA